MSFSEMAARLHCMRVGIKRRNVNCSWKQTLLPCTYKPLWSMTFKHPSVLLHRDGICASVSSDYTRGTFMTVFDSLKIDLRKPHLVYTFRVKINTDTCRAGMTIGVVDPDNLDPRSPQGCELCEADRGWGLFVCKGSRDKFTNGIYHGGKYICGKDAAQIRNGWRKDDVIEVQIQKGEIRFFRNDTNIPEVSVCNEKIQGSFVFAVTLYNSRLRVEAVSRVRRLSQFSDPRRSRLRIPTSPIFGACMPDLNRQDIPPISVM